MENENEVALDQFVTKLLEAKGIYGLDAEVMDKMKNELLTRLSDWLNMAVIKALPEAVLPEAERLLDANDLNGLQALFQKEVPDLQQILTQEMLKFKDVYLKP